VVGVVVGPRTALTAASCLWAIGPLVIVASGLPALQLTAMRGGVAALLFLAVLRLSRSRMTWAALRICLPGGLFFATSTAAFFAALRSTSVADATLIAALQPLVLLLHPEHGRARSTRSLLLLAGAMGGTALVVLGSAREGHRSLRGDSLAVAALLLGTGYLLATRRAREALSPVQVQCGVQLVAVAVFGPIVLLQGQPVRTGTAALLAVVVLVLVPGTGHLLLSWAAPYLPPATTAQLGMLNPVLAVLLAAWLLGQPLNGTLLLGAFAVLACVWGLARRESRCASGRGQPFARVPEVRSGGSWR